jgi:hypothetical protein
LEGDEYAPPLVLPDLGTAGLLADSQNEHRLKALNLAGTEFGQTLGSLLLRCTGACQLSVLRLTLSGDAEVLREEWQELEVGRAAGASTSQTVVLSLTMGECLPLSPQAQPAGLLLSLCTLPQGHPELLHRLKTLSVQFSPPGRPSTDSEALELLRGLMDASGYSSLQLHHHACSVPPGATSGEHKSPFQLDLEFGVEELEVY